MTKEQFDALKILHIFAVEEPDTSEEKPHRAINIIGAFIRGEEA